MEFAQWLQSRLNTHGCKTRIDGRVGPGTRKAIRQFQERENLPVTGLADERTVKALRKQPGQ